MIHQNESSTDRTIRIISGSALLVLGLLNSIEIYKITSLVLGSIFLVTGVTGFCGLYSLLGINTCGIKTKKTGNKTLTVDKSSSKKTTSKVKSKTKKRVTKK